MKRLYKKIAAFVLICVLALTCSVALTGCIDLDYTLLETKLESAENGYKANSEDINGISGCYKRVKAEYGEPNEPWYEYVVALFFYDENSAITYYNEILNGYAVPAVESEEYYDMEVVTQRVFSIVLYGTKLGVATALE